jgi:hypothetical protein
MYYEEKIVDGTLYIKTSPDGEWVASQSNVAYLIYELSKLDEAERLAVFMRFCLTCGRILEGSADHCTCHLEK